MNPRERARPDHYRRWIKSAMFSLRQVILCFRRSNTVKQRRREKWKVN